MLSFQNCAKVGFSAENPSANGVAQGTDPSARNDNEEDPPPVDPPDEDAQTKINLCKLSLDSLAALAPVAGTAIQNFALANEDHYGIYSEQIVNATLNEIFGINYFYNVENFKAADYQGQLYLRTKQLESLTNTEAEITVAAEKIIDISNGTGIYCLSAKEIGSVNDLEGTLIIEDAEVDAINNFNGTLILIRSKLKNLNNHNGKLHKLENSQVINKTQ